MRRYILVCCIFFTHLIICQSLLAAPVNDWVIYLPVKVDKAVVDAAKDMAYWLEKAGTGKYEVIQKEGGGKNGIRLIYYEEADISAAQKKLIRVDGQSFFLSADGLTDVRIIATGKSSFINGIYTFLQELGFRWYMPGDEWVKLGNVKQAIRLNKVYTPSFRDRMYAGSGGANAILGLDPGNSFRADFVLWNRRNRFNTDYPVRGHQGIAFYNANKEVLQKHPEYFCNGKVNRNARLNFDNPDLVDLLVNWSLTQKDTEEKFSAIGVDPADGSGGADDCKPITIKGVQTWSDKYFWLANQVASRLPETDTSTRVTMYAYSNHVDPPTFALHRNVYPLIIPYAFQRSSDPQQFIDTWAKKMNGRPMGIYDYWNITQWSICLPQFNLYTMADRLRFWKRSNINSLNLESTYAKGPMGHVFWLAGQLMWNVSLNFDSLYNAFLTDNFGGAAEDVRRMYDRWSLNYMGGAEPSFSYADLSKATTRVTDPAILNRLTELKAYVRFIELYENYSNNKTTNGYEEIIKYVLSIHHFRMLHTSALVALYIPKPKGYKTVTDKRTLELKYSRIKPLSRVEVEQIFQERIRAVPPPFKVSQLDFNIKKLLPDTVGKKMNIPLYLNNINNYQFYLPLKKKIKLSVGTTVTASIQILDQQGGVILEKNIAAGKTDYTNIILTLDEGVYTIVWGKGQRFSRIQFPRDIVVISSDHNYDNAGFPLHYVYVPKDVEEIVYQDVLGPGVNRRGYWLRPDGVKVQPQKLQANIYKIPVPLAYRGKVWTLNIGHRQFKMLNIPDYYSLNSFLYIE